MDPKLYWAGMTEGQAVQYSAVSCQMTVVGPATTWASPVPSYPPNMMQYPHPGHMGHPGHQSPVRAVHQPPPPDSPEVDDGLKIGIYKKYEALFKENGPMEPTDQKVLTCFIQLSKDERRVVMGCGSIKSFLCINPAFDIEGKLIHLNAKARSSAKEIPEVDMKKVSGEELFAMKAYKAGITVASSKSELLAEKFLADFSLRIPGDGQSDPAKDTLSDSQDEMDEFGSDESPESPGLEDKNLTKLCKSLISYLKEEDDHKLHGLSQNLYAAMNEVCPGKLNLMIDVKNRIIAMQSFNLCKDRIEEVSDMMNNFCTKHSNNNEGDTSFNTRKLSEVEYDSYDSVEDECSDISRPRSRSDSASASLSKLNVHCHEFIPRSPSTSLSEEITSLPKITKDGSTMTTVTKTTDVATCTLGLTGFSHIATMTVFTPCHKSIQTEVTEWQKSKNSDENEEIESGKIDEAVYEDVLYRAMMAEERVLHLQKDINVMRAKSRIQEFEALLPSERAKSNISLIKREISRIEAVFDCNLSAVRDGVALSQLQPLILKPLPICSAKDRADVAKVTKVTKRKDFVDAKVESSETDSNISYATAKSDLEETDGDEPKEIDGEIKVVKSGAVDEPYAMAAAAAASDVMVQQSQPQPEVAQPTTPEMNNLNAPVGGLDAMKMMLLKQNIMAMLTQINPVLGANPVLLEMLTNQYLAQHQQQLLAGMQLPFQPDLQSNAGLMAGMGPATGVTDAFGSVKMQNTENSEALPPVTPPILGATTTYKPPGLPVPNVLDSTHSQGPPGIEKKEMAGVSEVTMSAKKGRGRGRGSKMKNGPPGAGAGNGSVVDDSSSIHSGQNNSTYQFGDTGSSEFTFRKNVKRVAMTRREKTVTSNVPEGGKRKIEEMQDKVKGWDVGSALMSAGDAESYVERCAAYEKEAIVPVERSPSIDNARSISEDGSSAAGDRAVSIERIDNKVGKKATSAEINEDTVISAEQPSAEVTRERKSETPVFVPLTPPVPTVPTEVHYIQHLPPQPIPRNNSEEDWGDDLQDFETTPWKLSTFGPTILPTEVKTDSNQNKKSSRLPPGHSQKAPRFKKQEQINNNSLAAKLQKNKDKEAEAAKAKAIAPAPPPPTTAERRGKQLPVVASSICTVPVVLNKTPVEAAWAAPPKAPPKAAPTVPPTAPPKAPVKAASTEPPKGPAKEIPAAPPKTQSQSGVQEKPKGAKNKKPERTKPEQTKPETPKPELPKQKEKPQEKTKTGKAKPGSMSSLDLFEVSSIPQTAVVEDEWQQVCKKKKKNEATPVAVSKTQTTAASATPDKKSHEIFDKLIQKILGLHSHLTRNDAVDIISEVRQMKGGLNGMKLSQILDAANAIVATKRKDQAEEYNGPVIMSTEVMVDVNVVLFKSELCQFWVHGNCVKGAECQYAHGKDEIRPPLKYVLCSNFENGHCTHGSKCLFAHGKKELQAPPADCNMRIRKKSESGNVASRLTMDTFSGPAAAAALDPFPTLKPVEDFKSGEPCVICCGGIRPGLEERLSCGHVFHQTCIKRWVVGEERTCPTCRSHVLLEDEFPSLG